MMPKYYTLNEVNEQLDTEHKTIDYYNTAILAAQTRIANLLEEKEGLLVLLEKTWGQV